MHPVHSTLIFLFLGKMLPTSLSLSPDSNSCPNIFVDVTLLRLFFGYASILPSSRLVTLDSAQIGKAGHIAQLSGLTVDGAGNRDRRRNFPDVERFLHFYFF